jgi:hypothetical protein
VKTYTYTEARQRLAALLDQARREGRVQIRRRDGQLFLLLPVRPEGSPLDVPGVRVRLRPGETREWLGESRERSADRLVSVDADDNGSKKGKTRRKPARGRAGKSEKQSS